MKGLILITILSFACSGRSSGPPRFDTKTISVGKGAASVEVADLNGDHLPDILVANSEDSSVTVLLNKGNRNFVPAEGSPFYAGHFPNDINIADFNQDGKMDMAFANHEKKYFTVLLGNGKGQFQAAPHSPFAVQVKPHTHGIISADFNGDGYLDIATDSWAVDSILLLFGDGKGNFSNATYFATGKHPYQRLRTADLNGDHFPDIVTTNLDGKSITVLLGNGKGGFTTRFFDAGDTPFGVAIGDVNGDGRLDLAVVNSPSITVGNPGTDGLTILLGDGSGGFSPCKGSPLATGKGPTRLAIGDLNGDGKGDIVVTNYRSNDLSIFYMGSNGLLSSETITIGAAPDGVAIRDLDGDGKNDIIVSSSVNNTIQILFRR